MLDIIGQAANLDECTSICSFCSRMKRGKIYACAHRECYNVVALGQHLDDLSERFVQFLSFNLNMPYKISILEFINFLNFSFFMSVFHNGRLRTMKAHYTDM